MSHASVRKAIEVTLDTWAKARNPVVQIAWENAPFTPPPAGFIRAYLLPAGTGSDMVDGKHRRYTGLYQISIYTPTGAGPAAALVLCDALDTLFPVNSRFTADGLAVQVMTPVSPAPANQEPGWHVLPVSFTYRADVTL